MEQKLSFPIICLTLLLCSLPTESQILMSVYPPQVVLGSSSFVSTTFRCTISGNSNILGIFTMQLLRKRESDMDFVMVGEVTVTDPNPAFVPTAPQDIVSRGSMSGGIDVNTPTSSTLTLTLSTQDLVCTDKGEYQCKMAYQDATNNVLTALSNGTLSIYESEIQMSINPQEIVLGSSSPVSTTFTCTISGSANIRRIFFMQILRKRESDMDFVVVGEVQDPANPAFVPTAPQDIVSRGSMSGGIDVNTPTSSTLTLTLSTQDLVCTDKGEYQCKMAYQDAATSNIQIVLSNGTLSIYDQEPTTTERAQTLTNVTNKGEESGVDVVIG